MVPESILKLNVGGEVIQTSIQTLTKYPGSMLCAMFSYTENGKIFKREQPVRLTLLKISFVFSVQVFHVVQVINLD